MTKMKFYKQARTMYIEGNLPIDVISQNLNISRRTLFYWKKKYEWDKTYFEKKHNKEIFNQELLEFTEKFLKKLSKDIDNHIPSSKAEMYSFLNILKKIPQLKQCVNPILKSKPKTLVCQLTPKTIKQIKRNILGIDNI